MQRVGIISIRNQRIGHLLRLAPSAAEHYPVNRRRIVRHTLQRGILILRMHHIIYVLHRVGAFVSRANHNLLMVKHILPRNSCSLSRHRGREHQHLAVLRHACQYLIDGIHEAHVQHLIGLVEHHCVHMFQAHDLAFQQVDQPSRRGNDDVHTATQPANLHLDTTATIHRNQRQIRQILREISHVASDLQAQLACRRQNQRLRHNLRRINALNHRQSERRRFARARLSQGHQIPVALQQCRYNLRLHRHRLLKAHVRYSSQQLRGKPQFFK